ncbi:porphobilinogen synthase [bacterium]|jgi:porphobilinogen synthase|nr:porphobilinogen synthase [bacterium]
MNHSVRLRRLRYNSILRDCLQENQVGVQDLVLPLFIHEREESLAIPSMPGHSRLSIEDLKTDVDGLLRKGMNKVLLFGIVEQKDAQGSASWNPEGIVQKAITQLRESFGKDLFVIADLCFCEYTDHGHCGPLVEETVDNDQTLLLSGNLALSYAHAGVDMVAPSGMMDGIVYALRSALDENGFNQLPIMGYSAKFSSSFYGPFRDAAGSSPSFGDRRSYQMNPANLREALREVQIDIEEGVDIVMVKPALAYLDVIREVRNRWDLPVAAYNVSGEYSMVKAAAQRGWIDEKAVALESLLSMKRAGSDLILSYWARDFVQW